MTEAGTANHEWDHQYKADFSPMFPHKKWLSLASDIDFDAIDKYPLFDRNTHLFGLNSCNISICGSKMESYILRHGLALLRS